MMEFNEIFTSPFTTPTTCYSCGRRIIDNRLSRYGSKRATANDDDDIGVAVLPTDRNKVKIAIQFSTEVHILGVEVDIGDDDDRDIGQTKVSSRNFVVETSSSPMPRDSKRMSCVGYYMHGMEKDAIEIQETNTIPDCIQAMIFIDPVLIEKSLSIDHDVIIDKDDNLSVISQRQQYHRRQNQHYHNHNHIPSTASTASLASSTMSGSVGNYHRKSYSELSRESHNTANSDTHNNDTGSSSNNDNNNENEEKEKTKKIARLVLQNLQYPRLPLSVECDAGTGKDEKNKYSKRQRQQKQQLQYSSSISLDFRPLAPCIAQWKIPSSSQDNKETANNFNKSNSSSNNDIVGVWLGSADDAILRFYVPSLTEPSALVSVPLPEEHFSVDSPVMAIDFCTVNWSDDHKNRNFARSSCINHKCVFDDDKRYSENRSDDSLNTMNTNANMTHTLALGCQDGTIQIITFQLQWDDNESERGNSETFFGKISSKKIMVDGPLISLKLDYNIYTSLRLIVGSLCGYVCQLTHYHDHNGHNRGWDGPFMIVHDLPVSNKSLINIEESILVVDAWNNYILIGTQFGRCLLYSTGDSENYFLVWQVTLPYSIHGITIHSDDDDDNCSMILAITTRRSFHLFENSSKGITWRRKPAIDRFSAEMGRNQLLQILHEIKYENNVSDLRCQKLVRETIEDMIQKVEKHPPIYHKKSDLIEKSSTDYEEDVAFIVSNVINYVIDRLELDEKEINAAPDTPQWEYSSSSSDDDDVDDDNNHDDGAITRKL